MLTDVSKVSSGIPGLDDVLGGGFPADRIYLVQGDPGAGKTTLALQFLLEGVARGERVLYFTLSETKAELEAVALSHGWSLDGLNLHELSAVEDFLAPGSVQTVYRSADVELTETTEKLLSIVKDVKPTRAVFDSLSELRLLARDPLRYRRQILSLKQYFSGTDCTVLLLDDRTSGQNDIQLESIAHGVVTMEQLSPAYGVDRRRMRVQKLRGVRFRSGYHDFTIVRGGIHVFPRLIASEHRDGYKPNILSTGLDGLDQLLGGGLDAGASSLFIGPAGVGKSTVAMQFAIACAKRGETAALYSFEESPRTLYSRMEALGQDVRRYVDSGKILYHQIDPAELTPGEFVHMVRKHLEEENLKVVIIDSLNGFLNAMPEERFLILQLHELLSYLGQKGVATILVMAQQGMLGSSMASAVDVSYLADTVLLFRFYEFRGHIKQALSVVKRRGGNHERAIRDLTIEGREGIVIGPPLEQFRGVLSGVPALMTVNEKGSNGESRI